MASVGSQADPRAAMETQTPTSNVIGKYRLLAKLGHGGMADVFLAASSGPGGFNKLSVLKLLRDLDEQHGIDMFLEEARVAARLNHPNLVQTYEVGNANEQYFIAMEFIDGPALNRIWRRARIPLGVGLYVISMVLEGLRYAHALKGFDGAPLMLVHRDLSPQNVLVSYEGDCKIVDFGIAKSLDSPLVTRQGLFKGKVTYMPPEQVRGLLVDQRADVFAAGVMLAELISGRRLWQGESEMGVAQRLSTGNVPRLAGLGPEIAAELIDLSNWAIEPDRERRCPSATALQQHLDAHIRSSGLQASRRDLGELVANTFAADREKLLKTIAAQLKKADSTPTAVYCAASIPTAAYGAGSRGSEEGSSDPAKALRTGASAMVQPIMPAPTTATPSVRAAPSPHIALSLFRWVAVLVGALVALAVCALGVGGAGQSPSPPLSRTGVPSIPPPPELDPYVEVRVPEVKPAGAEALSSPATARPDEHRSPEAAPWAVKPTGPTGATGSTGPIVQEPDRQRPSVKTPPRPPAAKDDALTDELGF